MSASRFDRWEKSQKKSSRKKRVEVLVTRIGAAGTLVGKLVHRGRQLCTGKEVQIPGLNHALPIVAHRTLGELTISITVLAPDADFMRLKGRTGRWRERVA